MKTLVALTAHLILLAPMPENATAQSREKVQQVFQTYEALNADFVHSVASGTGNGGKSYSALRRETEKFAEGPYSKALAEAKKIICSSGDRELLASLLRVAEATSNSANEQPTVVLNEVASCKPDLLRELAATLRPSERKSLASRSPPLKALLQ